jgi:hypothetical protein
LRHVPEARSHLEAELMRAPEVENDYYSLLEAAHSLKDPTLRELLEPLGGDPDWMPNDDPDWRVGG